MTASDDQPDSLDDATDAAITKLCEEGESLFEARRYDEACAKYLKALDLVPEPKDRWSAALWIYTALADSRFEERKFEEALRWAIESKKAAGGLENPFVWFLAGKCDFELGNLKEAANELMTAYVLDGDRIFEGQDPKYRAYLSTVAILDESPSK